MRIRCRLFGHSFVPDQDDVCGSFYKCSRCGIVVFYTGKEPWPATTTPSPTRRVLIFWKNGHNRNRISIGFYVPRLFKESEDANEEFAEYDEETDEYYLREGWWEEPWESEHFYLITGKVYGWSPTPENPVYLLEERE